MSKCTDVIHETIRILYFEVFLFTDFYRSLGHMYRIYLIKCRTSNSGHMWASPQSIVKIRSFVSCRYLSSNSNKFMLQHLTK